MIESSEFHCDNNIDVHDDKRISSREIKIKMLCDEKYYPRLKFNKKATKWRR